MQNHIKETNHPGNTQTPTHPKKTQNHPGKHPYVTEKSKHTGNGKYRIILETPLQTWGQHRQEQSE
jgi:hypothetical protein